MNAIPSQAQYEMSERLALNRQLLATQVAPLSERQAARKETANAMKNPELFAERTRWLFQGNYGHGAMLEAHRIARNNRCNKVALIGQLLAALEWQCPPEWAAQAWKSLNRSQQNAVDNAVLQVIRDFLSQS